MSLLGMYHIHVRIPSVYCGGCRIAQVIFFIRQSKVQKGYYSYQLTTAYNFNTAHQMMINKR